MTYNSATVGIVGAPALGGGICVAGGSVSLSSDTVEYNSATGNNQFSFSGVGYGGGIYIASGATVTLCSDTVEFNTASANYIPEGYGGGIYIAGGSTVYIDTAAVANTINNTEGPGYLDNIYGSYILQNY
jgi:hypothetical protein